MRLFILSLYLLLVSPVGAQLSLRTEEKERIAQTIQQFPNQTSFSIAFVEGDEVLFYGVKKEKGKTTEVQNQDHIFQIGSLSKVFTTQLLMNLVQEGKIPGLDEPVQKSLPFEMKGKPAFTFRQLASHSSGLPSDPDNLNTTIFNAKNPYKKYTKADLQAYLSENLVMRDSPGASYKYSNLGMTLLGLTLTEATDKSYEQLLQEHIFGPLGMNHSSTQKEALQATFTQGLDKKGKGTPYWEFQVVAPAGGIMSTTEDLVKYVKDSFGKLQGPLSAMKERNFSHSEKMDIALGWHIIKTYTQTPFLWHNGGTGGFKSSLGLHPERQKSVIILSNVGRSAKRREIDILCYTLMNMRE